MTYLEKKIQGLVFERKAGAKIDMVEIKHRKKLTEAAFSSRRNEWKFLPYF